MSIAMRHWAWGVGLALLVTASSAGAQSPPEQARPEREIVTAFEYPRLGVEPAATVTLDLVVKNNGRKDEVVVLDLAESPKDLRCRIEEYGKTVGGLFLGSGEKKTLKVSAKPKSPKSPDGEIAEGTKATVAAGTYKFAVKAATEDGKLTATAAAELTVKPASGEEGEAPKEPVAITCSYPNLRGANDGDFKFSVNIHNNTDLEDMAALRAEAPSGWEVVFKPSYENKYIGSLKIEPNLSKSVDVEVKPAPGSEIGKYPITVFSKLSKKELEAKRELTVELTGTYRLQCRTLKDVLSLTAKGGQESNLSMYVMNRGTAPLANVSFDSFKPENWKVTFKPERIESIPPGKLEQVEVLITPHNDAIVGDYSVNVSARGEKGQDDIEFRVTVKPSTAWAWVGVGTIVAVIVTLSVLFKVLGRR